MALFLPLMLTLSHPRFGFSVGRRADWVIGFRRRSGQGITMYSLDRFYESDLRISALPLRLAAGRFDFFAVRQLQVEGNQKPGVNHEESLAMACFFMAPSDICGICRRIDGHLARYLDRSRRTCFIEPQTISTTHTRTILMMMVLTWGRISSPTMIFRSASMTTPLRPFGMGLDRPARIGDRRYRENRLRGHPARLVDSGTHQPEYDRDAGRRNHKVDRRFLFRRSRRSMRTAAK